MATAVLAIGQGVVSLLAGILRRGHDDDAIDAAEGVIVAKVILPVLSELLAKPIPEGAASIDANTNEIAFLGEKRIQPSSPARVQALIKFGDDALAEWCSQLKETKYPCHDYVPGKSSAGTYFYSKWKRLRGYLVNLAKIPAAAGSPVAYVSGTVANVSAMNDPAANLPTVADFLEGSNPFFLAAIGVAIVVILVLAVKR